MTLGLLCAFDIVELVPPLLSDHTISHRGNLARLWGL